jgi:hypothetical protein
MSDLTTSLSIPHVSITYLYLIWLRCCCRTDSHPLISYRKLILLPRTAVVASFRQPFLRCPSRHISIPDPTTSNRTYWVFSNHYTFSSDIDVWYYHLRERLQRLFQPRHRLIRHWCLILPPYRALTETSPSHQTLISDLTLGKQLQSSSTSHYHLPYLASHTATTIHSTRTAKLLRSTSNWTLLHQV